uniref:Putative secreted protein n=1 Tax=Ixodes ricinus TaxID=34613 RepID=A0A6B0TYY6_IXORI
MFLSLAKIIFAIKLCLSEWFDYNLFQKSPRWLLSGNDIKTKHKTLKRLSGFEPTCRPMNPYSSCSNTQGDRWPSGLKRTPSSTRV